MWSSEKESDKREVRESERDLLEALLRTGAFQGLSVRGQGLSDKSPGFEIEDWVLEIGTKVSQAKSNIVARSFYGWRRRLSCK